VATDGSTTQADQGERTEALWRGRLALIREVCAATFAVAGMAWLILAVMDGPQRVTTVAVATTVISGSAGMLALIAGVACHIMNARSDRNVARVLDQVRAAGAECAEAMRSEFGGRLEALEQEAEQRDEEFARGWVNGAARTAEQLAPNGHVRHLRPAGAPPEPRRQG